MVIDWSQPAGPTDPPVRPSVPAAEYVRMSTEHQRYSTDNQSAVIRTYAMQRGYDVVRTYADEGKSGLNLGGRAALQKLLADIESGNADYKVLISTES